MGVLRFKDTVDELLDKDPYELFSVTPPQRRGFRLSPGAWRAVTAGALVALCGLGAVFWSAQQDHAADGEAPFAYFEVRAIDPDGRPVAGAIVRTADKQLGVTDTFGEWRRFMRVKLGSTVMLTISKKAGGGGWLAAQKNLAVPVRLPTDGDLEIAGSVQLGRGTTAKGAALASRRVEPAASAAVARVALAAPAAGASQKGGDSEPGAHERAETDELSQMPLDASEPEKPLAKPVVAVASADSAPVNGASDDDMTVSMADGSQVIQNAKPAAAAFAAAAADQAPAFDFSRVWIVADGSATPALTEVLTALKRRSLELGLKLDPQSPLRLKLRHFGVGTRQTASGQGASGVIRVSGSYGDAQHQTRLFSYLRNYQDNALQTARDVLWAATLHVRSAHVLRKTGERFVLAPTNPRLWELTPGRSLESADGRILSVEASGPDATELAVSADSEGRSPCGGGATSCTVRVPGLSKAPPVSGWQRLPLRVLGPMTPDTEIYVGGYQALPSEGATLSYWGVPTGGANLTVIRGGQVLQRSRIETLSGRVPTISLPGAAVSKK